MVMSSVIWASCSAFSAGLVSAFFSYLPSSFFSSFFSSLGSGLDYSLGLAAGLATWFMQTTKSVSLMPIFSTESSLLRVLPLKTTLRVSADMPFASWILFLRVETLS